MNDNVAVTIINLLCDKLGIVADWTEENALPYIQSLLDEVASAKYSLNITLVIIFGVLFLIGFCFLIYGVIRQRKYPNNYYAGETARGIGIVLMIFGFLSMSIVIYSAIEWKMMPTVKSYQWLISMLKAH